MYSNYLRVAVRSLLRHRAYSAINIVGLAVGIASCVLLTLFVQNELSYDRFHSKAAHIYRIGLEWQFADGQPNQRMPRTAGPVAAALVNDSPGIVEAVRFLPLHEYSRLHFQRGTTRSYEDAGYIVDDSVFEVFSFPLQRGDTKSALSAPFSLVLTEPLARKYFGTDDPIGEVITVQDSLRLRVTGVLEPVPANSHLAFDFLVSYETLPYLAPSMKPDRWDYLGWYTYVLVADPASLLDVKQQIHDVSRRYNAEWEESTGHTLKHFLQPLVDIYLHANLSYEIGPLGSATYVYLMSSVALLILLIACINFINLTTARSQTRAQEIGQRKVVGALRYQLICQFLVEGVVATWLALVLAVVLASVLLPEFSRASGGGISLEFLQDGSMELMLIVLALVVGVLSGAYPATLLSRFDPIDVLKSTASPSSKGSSVRRGLVVFQFATSVVLVISTIVIYTQVRYMRHKDLGFDKERIVVLNIRGDASLQQRSETIRTEFRKVPGVQDVSASAFIPGRMFNDVKLDIEGPAGVERKRFLLQFCDRNFVETFGIKLVAGRDFSEEFATDREAAFMANQSGIEHLGWGRPDKAIGKTIGWKSGTRQLIDVVEDFHHHSLQNPIEPMIFVFDPNWFAYLSVKIGHEEMAGTLAALEETWGQVAPGRAFDYFYLDADFAQQYRAVEGLGDLLRLFSATAIVIGCLGLLGLISFFVAQRTREVGIRKTLGASVFSVALLLSSDLLRLVVLGAIVACPIAYYLTDQWLLAYPYRIHLGAWMFILGLSVVFFVALVPIASQALRAAIGVPADALRCD